MTVIVDEYDIAYGFCKAVAPSKEPSPEMLKAVASWKRAESGHMIERNNPWNLTHVPNMPGFKAMDGSFAVFDDLASGIDATAYFLEFQFSDGNWRGYDPIVAAIRAGDATYLMQAIAQSAWDANKYGTTTGGPNHIVEAYDSFGSFLMDNVNPGPLGSLPNANPTYGVTPVTTPDLTPLEIAQANVATSQHYVSVWGTVSADHPLSPGQLAAYEEDKATLAKDQATLAALEATPAPTTATPEAIASSEATAVPGYVEPNAWGTAIDLSAPQTDAYKLAQQWYEAISNPTAANNSTTDPLFRNPNAAGELTDLLTDIIGQGEAYYPIASYPAIPAAVLAYANWADITTVQKIFLRNGTFIARPETQPTS